MRILKLVIIIFIINSFLFEISAQNVNSYEEDSKAEMVELILIKNLFMDSRIKEGRQHIFNKSDNSFIMRGNFPRNEKTNLEKIRKSKSAESIKQIKAEQFENGRDASDFAIKNLNFDSVIIAEKLTDNSFLIKVFVISYEENVNSVPVEL